jgi:quaternary ammonium compound-resistance protein SugE
MAWVELLIAGVFEVAWAIGLKYTQGFSRFWPSAGTVAAMVASFFFLSRAVRSLPIGTAYAVWTGVGAVGTALLGMLLFDESRDAARLMCIGLIVLGIAGLRLASSA